MSDDLPQYESLEEVAEVAKQSGRRLRDVMARIAADQKRYGIGYTFFTATGEMYPNDDGERELIDDEFDRRFMRVNGEVICNICQEPYWKHPDETRVLGFEDRPFTKRLCNGWFGKL